MPTIFARQGGAIGLYEVCSNAAVGNNETYLGQQGWDIGVNFDTSQQFVERMNASIAQWNGTLSQMWSGRTGRVDRKIQQLGISSHGSADGTDPNTFGGIAIDGPTRPWLRASTLQTFLPFLNAVGEKLETNAVVYLFACSIGGTQPGLQLLRELSRVWRGRRVVGFVEEGHQRQGGGPGVGQWRRGQQGCDLPGVQFGQPGRWGTWAIPGAVSARFGEILPRGQ